MNHGVMVDHDSHTESDSLEPTYIPSRADFLIACSTIPGFKSFRNTLRGSWFIQTFCHVMEREMYSRDLLSILTR